MPDQPRKPGWRDGWLERIAVPATVVVANAASIVMVRHLSRIPAWIRAVVEVASFCFLGLALLWLLSRLGRKS